MNRPVITSTFCILFLCLVYACQQEPSKPLGKDDTPYLLEYGALPTPDLPADNQLTEAGVSLGRMLFYDRQLSRDNIQACADCHRQSSAFSDSLRFSLGVDNLPGTRHSMSITNMAWNTNGFFWDGRAELLRHQAILPIQDPLEMDETLDNVIQKLSSDTQYEDAFILAFGDDLVTEQRIALALEQFMLSIVSYQSKFDRYLAGLDTLTAEEERGRFLYFTEYNPFFPEDSGADCEHCHGGANFENDSYMNNGLDEEQDFSDLGRFVVTQNPMHRAQFKVPSLRNIALSQPYMHDGRFNTLEEVIDHYDHGVRFSSTVDPALLQTIDQGLGLSDEDKSALVKFLHTLTDENFINNEAYSNPF